MVKTIKIATLAIAVLLTSQVFATEIGATFTHDRATAQNEAGVVVGTQYENLGIEASVDRAINGKNRYDTVGVAATYKLLDLGPIAIAPKIAANYVRPDKGVTGYTAGIGVQATMPVTKSTKLVANYDYDRGQKRVDQFTGSSYSIGIRTQF